MQRPVVYLASPFGFSDSAKKFILPRLSEKLEAVGVEVYEPFERAQQSGLGPQSGTDLWALDLAHANVNKIKSVDAIFAVLNGSPPDEGVAVEIGVAIALGKPTFIFRDDWRNSADNNLFPCNLMLYGGLPRKGWEAYIYNSIDEISDPEKALVPWIALKLDGYRKAQAKENSKETVSK